MSHSNLPEITKYPHLAMMELYKNQAFVSLLLNIPNIKLEDEQTEDDYDAAVFTFDYVDGLVTEQKSFVCIDTTINQSSPSGLVAGNSKLFHDFISLPDRIIEINAVNFRKLYNLHSRNI